MTFYHGGKKRIGERLAQVIVETSIEIENFKIRGYCEPFGGMLSVYKHIPYLFEEKGLGNLEYLAGDTNESVVEMWKAAQIGWKPPSETCSKKKFEKLKSSNSCTALKGFVGHAYTFRGVFFDGYFLHPKSRRANNRTDVIETSRELHDVGFFTGPYTQFGDLRGFVIYCDPPYEGTSCRYYDGKGYKNRLAFDNKSFWDWCCKMSRENIVFVSEYAAPTGYEKVYGPPRSAKKCERLFVRY